MGSISAPRLPLLPSLTDQVPSPTQPDTSRFSSGHHHYSLHDPSRHPLAEPQAILPVPADPAPAETTTHPAQGQKLSTLRRRAHEYHAHSRSQDREARSPSSVMSIVDPSPDPASNGIPRQEIPSPTDDVSPRVPCVHCSSSGANEHGQCSVCLERTRRSTRYYMTSESLYNGRSHIVQSRYAGECKDIRHSAQRVCYGLPPGPRRIVTLVLPSRAYTVLTPSLLSARGLNEDVRMDYSARPLDVNAVPRSHHRSPSETSPSVDMYIRSGLQISSPYEMSHNFVDSPTSDWSASSSVTRERRARLEPSYSDETPSPHETTHGNSATTTTPDRVDGHNERRTFLHGVPVSLSPSGGRLVRPVSYPSTFPTGRIYHTRALSESVKDEEIDSRHPPRADAGVAAGKRTKVEMACSFCRSRFSFPHSWIFNSLRNPGRKLKCNGGRPVCNVCVKRHEVCEYDAVVRRRGPGIKKREQLAKADIVAVAKASPPQSTYSPEGSNAPAANDLPKPRHMRQSSSLAGALGSPPEWPTSRGSYYSPPASEDATEIWQQTNVPVYGLESTVRPANALHSYGGSASLGIRARRTTSSSSTSSLAGALGDTTSYSSNSLGYSSGTHSSSDSVRDGASTHPTASPAEDQEGFSTWDGLSSSAHRTVYFDSHHLPHHFTPIPSISSCRTGLENQQSGYQNPYPSPVAGALGWTQSYPIQQPSHTAIQPQAYHAQQAPGKFASGADSMIRGSWVVPVLPSPEAHAEDGDREPAGTYYNHSSDIGIAGPRYRKPIDEQHSTGTATLRSPGTGADGASDTSAPSALCSSS